MAVRPQFPRRTVTRDIVEQTRDPEGVYDPAALRAMAWGGDYDLQARRDAITRAMLAQAATQLVRDSAASTPFASDYRMGTTPPGTSAGDAAGRGFTPGQGTVPLDRLLDLPPTTREDFDRDKPTPLPESEKETPTGGRRGSGSEDNSDVIDSIMGAVNAPVPGGTPVPAGVPLTAPPSEPPATLPDTPPAPTPTPGSIPGFHGIPAASPNVTTPTPSMFSDTTAGFPAPGNAINSGRTGVVSEGALAAHAAAAAAAALSDAIAGGRTGVLSEGAMAAQAAAAGGKSGKGGDYGGPSITTGPVDNSVTSQTMTSQDQPSSTIPGAHTPGAITPTGAPPGGYPGEHSDVPGWGSSQPDTTLGKVNDAVLGALVSTGKAISDFISPTPSAPMASSNSTPTDFGKSGQAAVNATAQGGMQSFGGRGFAQGAGSLPSAAPTDYDFGSKTGIPGYAPTGWGDEDTSQTGGKHGALSDEDADAIAAAAAAMGTPSFTMSMISDVVDPDTISPDTVAPTGDIVAPTMASDTIALSDFADQAATTAQDAADTAAAAAAAASAAAEGETGGSGATTGTEGVGYGGGETSPDPGDPGTSTVGFEGVGYGDPDPGGGDPDPGGEPGW